MFDLEQSVAAWRREMAAQGVSRPEILDELEAHLREDIEQRLRSGIDLPTAFAEAVIGIGDAKLLRRDFARADAVFSHDRVYTALLAVVALYFAAGVALLLWVTATAGAAEAIGLRSTRFHHVWQIVPPFAYLLGSIVNLLARLCRWPVARRLTLFLNVAFLPIIPFATLLGIYGLWKVDKEQRRYV
jgi:hypothetical protein